jgi:hypothetical protein
MLKDLFGKGKCALGFHSGDWRYIDDQHCQQVRICPRCNNESHQLVHTWEDWQYAVADACEMKRHCSRCQEVESKTEHVWAAPVYEREGACTQVRPCSRCAERTPAGAAHIWNTWVYENAAGPCSQRSACSRCGEVAKETRTAHDWGDWRTSDFYAVPVRVCRRCGELVFRLDESGEPSPVSLQMFDRAVQDVLTSKDVGVVRERISRHRVALFTPVAGKYFAFAVDQLAPDPDSKDTLRKLSEVIDRCRTEGVDQVFSPPFAPAATQSSPRPAAAVARTEPPSKETFDPRFVGHWRHTEILGGTYSIDTHCVLDPQGHFQWSTRSSRGAGIPEQGNWHSSLQTLTLNFDSGAKRTFECVVQEATLFCPQERRYRLWQRVR